MLPMPTEVRIGSHVWKISGDPEVLEDIQLRNPEEKPDPYYYGRADHVLLKIYVDLDLPLSSQQSTLLHEIMHCCAWSSGAHLDDMKSDNAEEYAISALEHPLLYVIQNNSKLMDWLGTVDG
jgi:hypothetical protein